MVTSIIQMYSLRLFEVVTGIDVPREQEPTLNVLRHKRIRSPRKAIR